MPITFYPRENNRSDYNVLWKPSAKKQDPKILFKPDNQTGDEIKMIGARKAGESWILPPIWASIKGLQRLYGEESLRYDPEIRTRFFSSPAGWPLRSYFEVQDAVPRWNDFRDYQKEAIIFNVSSPYPGSMLSLSPGLGKTPVSIQSALALRNLGHPMSRILVVTLFSLMETWEGELDEWAPDDTKEIAYQKGPAIFDLPQWTIINWETLVSKADLYACGWDLVILDESVLVKNGGERRSAATQRWKAAKGLREGTWKIWELSGSPTSRFADDLWAQFDLLYPKVFTSYWRFAETYCHVETTPWGQRVIGTRRDIDFEDEFKDLKFTRDKKDVLQLPEIHYETIHVNLSGMQRDIYDQVRKEFIAELETGQRLEVASKISQMTRLLQITSNTCNLGEDWPALSEKLDTFIRLAKDDYFELPIILWTHWVPGARHAYQRLQEEWVGTVEYLSAETKERQRIVDRFQKNGTDILIVSLGVGKFGFTMTNARTAVYLDKSWDGDAYYQSLSRIPRYGLDHEATIYSMVARRTVDSHVQRNLGKKAVSLAKVSNADLASLLRSLE